MLYETIIPSTATEAEGDLIKGEILVEIRQGVERTQHSGLIGSESNLTLANNIRRLYFPLIQLRFFLRHCTDEAGEKIRSRP